MKASSFFGGTNPKETGKGVKQVGHKGTVQNRTGSIPRQDTVKQAKSSPVPTNISRINRTKQVGSTGSAS